MQMMSFKFSAESVEWRFGGTGFHLHSEHELNIICKMIILWNNVNKLVNTLPVFVNLVNNIRYVCFKGNNGHFRDTNITLF